MTTHHRLSRRLPVFAALGAALLALLPSASSATTYTYTEGSTSDLVPSFSFTTSLNGAALDNLAPGTDITGTVTPFTFEPNASANLGQDQLGFPIGGPWGSAYYFANSGPTVMIGTNASGQITSWAISEGIFASYPAVPGENPNDFFATYTLTTTNLGDTLTLIQDNDAGLAPPGTTSGAGTFSGTPTPVPGPTAGAGIPGLVAAFGGFLAWTRRRKAAAVS
jgi:hypothetical protein